tara:strand:+ start:407 stop:685 length:279 start_codon:yes stop_codon:yes gene_type:complete
MKTIIEKIELSDNNEIVNYPIGYTVNVDLINEINNNYDNSLGLFSIENKNELNNGDVLINTFFQSTSFVFEARLQTDSDLIELTEITNINQL